MSRALICLLAAALFVAGEDARVPLRILVVNSQVEAAALRARLAAGADFAVLAREVSTDATAVDGGLLGAVDPAGLRSEIREAIRGLAPGQLSPVFRLPSGFAVVKRLPDGELAELDAAQRARQAALRAEGSVHFDFDIGGLNEAEAALASWPKPAGWNSDPARMCDARRDSLADLTARAATLVAKIGPSTPPSDALSLHVAYGQIHAYRGEMADALAEWEAARRIAAERAPQTVSYLEELLGIGYLHQSDAANGVFEHPGERCIFPIRPEFRYAKTADAEKAVAHFRNVLKDHPDDLEVRWLLDVAEMTLGTSHARFQSAEDLGRFRDVAPQAGLAFTSMAGGLIVDDLDGDGQFDVVASSQNFCAPMHFFHNNGDGTFADRSAASGVAAQLGGLTLIQADYNNDGCPDILVLRGGWQLPMRKSLLRNNCNGTFTDVTREAGLAEPTSTQTAVWADVNNDGLLDLYVGNENGPNQLFLNQGNGTFREVAHAAGVDVSAFTKAVAAADFDGDGWVDLYAANYRGDGSLFRNNHDGTFTDVARQAGVLGPGHAFPAWFFDYDNDGWPDLLVTSYVMSVDETARTYLGLPHNSATMRLYRNLGNGAFRDVTAETGLDKVFMPMGSNFGDVDNDGYPDIYLGTGDPSYASVVPNVLLHNQGGRRFIDITVSSGTGELHKGHGVAFADIDGDGDEDILEVVGGATPGDSHAFRLFENPGQGNDWLSVRLVGVKANRSAIGARIHVTANGRSIWRTVGSGGSFGASPLEQHIGLGKAGASVSLEIFWPGDPQPQRFAGVAKNQAIEVKQFAAAYRNITRKAVKLGGARAH
jgi:tetratricopeptide (TPR) repeat protein